MRRIFGDFAYSDAPRAGCWWDETCKGEERPALAGAQSCDVAIIGAGFTGLSAALALAEAGVSVCVLEAQSVGWGASGRNGGFCCLGGGLLSDTQLDQRFGKAARQAWRQAELAAIDHVEGLITKHGWEVDRHSEGETQLAHRPKDFEAMKREVDHYDECYGIKARLTAQKDLAAEGMNAGFAGAITVPAGFALNPRKYVMSLAKAAEDAGAKIFHHSPVSKITRRGAAHVLQTAAGQVVADKVVIATNGYSSEDLPDWLAGRYMPTQSSIIVTRPMRDAELEAQGWTSRQMSYDTRHLLHYFRLMPDNRMLFGVRGGLRATAASERRAIARARADFERMFPAWKDVETPHAWSGMVCIARDQMPFVGPVPEMPGVYASLCYHGNGVAMASYCGTLLADVVLDRAPERVYPEAIRQPLKRFELGRFRRAVMPFAYAGFALMDR